MSAQQKQSLTLKGKTKVTGRKQLSHHKNS